MSGLSFPTITQNSDIRTLEAIQIEQDRTNSATVYHELSRCAVEGSALSVCMSRSDRDPDYSNRLHRILGNLRTQLTDIPEGDLELRSINRRYRLDSLDTQHFFALGDTIDDLVSANIREHYEEQKHAENNALDISNFDPPLPLVPRSIGRLRSIVCLNLQNNVLKELPQELFELDRLRELHLGYNYLKTLPEAIGRLHHLRVLNVEQNQLEALPRSIQYLSNLEILRAPHNQLTNFEVNIERLYQLRALYLSNNRLTSITLYPAPRLDYLDLENNRLTLFPRVEVLHQGCQVYLSGNSLHDVNIHVIKNEALQVYFVEHKKPEVKRKRSSEEENVARQGL